MNPKYSAQERLKIIEKVILGNKPVARVCREAGISRVLFYRWLKKYKESSGTPEILTPGRRPVAQKAQIIPRKTLKIKFLSPQEKQEMLERVIVDKQPVSEVCQQYDISRTLFYRLKKRYEEAALEEKLRAVSPQARRITRYFRQAPEKYEKAVLDLVAKYPEYGIRKLVANLPQVAGVSIVGHHGVQNILRRNNLSLYEQRLAYSRAQITPVTRVISKWEQVFAKFIVLPVETRRTILKFSGVTALSTFTTVVVFGLLGYLITVFGQAAPIYRPGLFFASIALLVGMIFFTYSMKYYFTLALVLSFSTQTGDSRVSGGSEGKSWLARIFGLGNGNGKAGLPAEASARVGGLQPNLDHIKLKRYPFISIHLPFYNEKKVVQRILSACTSFDYPAFEVIICDDSNDETVQIVKEWAKHPQVKVLHRPTREGFKGGALSYALKAMDPRTEFVVVFDADFVPYPDTLIQFMKYFKATGGWEEQTHYQAAPIQTMPYETFAQAEISNEQRQVLDQQLGVLLQKSPTAVVAGYQWHVLNKSENWITRGVRTEYAGSYVIERPGQEIINALKIIHGSVYCIRADVLKHFGWGTSITEDFELTLRIYEQGFKVIYTPYIQAPSECVSTIKRLIRQRMRWAEGHSFNVKKMFLKLLFSPKLTFTEKLEFLYISPYYLQAFFFLLGTLSWLISETVFQARLPFWTSLWGWSLVLTNFFALPLMNAVGLFLEESEEKDYLGLLSFVALSYLLVPFQAYAAVKGFLESKEGPWFRTPKTGLITDVFTRGRFYRWIWGIFGRPSPSFVKTSEGYGAVSKPALAPTINSYLSLATANNRFSSFGIRPKRLRWVSKVVLVILLATSVTLFSLTRGVPEVLATNIDNYYLWTNTTDEDSVDLSTALVNAGLSMRGTAAGGTNTDQTVIKTTNAYWYSRQLPTGTLDATIPSGSYTFNTYVTTAPTGTKTITWTVAVGYCSGGSGDACGTGATYTALATSSNITYTSSTSTGLNAQTIGTVGSATTCTAAAKCRVYVLVSGVDSVQGGSFKFGYEGSAANYITNLGAPSAITVPENIILLAAATPFVIGLVLWMKKRKALAMNYET